MRMTENMGTYAKERRNDSKRGFVIDDIPLKFNWLAKTNGRKPAITIRQRPKEDGISAPAVSTFPLKSAPRTALPREEND